MERTVGTFKDSELAVVTVSSDRVKTIKAMMAKANCSLPVLRDEEGEVFDAYRAFAVPTIYIIDQQGDIYTSWSGSVDDLELQLTENVRFLLSGHQPPQETVIPAADVDPQG